MDQACIGQVHRPARVTLHEGTDGGRALAENELNLKRSGLDVGDRRGTGPVIDATGHERRAKMIRPLARDEKTAMRAIERARRDERLLVQRERDAGRAGRTLPGAAHDRVAAEEEEVLVETAEDGPRRAGRSRRAVDNWKIQNRGSLSDGAGQTGTESTFSNSHANVGFSSTILSRQVGKGYVIGTDGVINVNTTVGSPDSNPGAPDGTGPADYQEYVPVPSGKYLSPRSLYDAQRKKRLGL